MSDLEKDLRSVINRHSIENESNTPDLILVQYLIGCLAAFSQAIKQREDWYGCHLEPGGR